MHSKNYPIWKHSSFFLIKLKSCSLSPLAFLLTKLLKIISMWKSHLTPPFKVSDNNFTLLFWPKPVLLKVILIFNVSKTYPILLLNDVSLSRCSRSFFSCLLWFFPSVTSSNIFRKFRSLLWNSLRVCIWQLPSVYLRICIVVYSTVFRCFLSRQCPVSIPVFRPSFF